ncbi:MAG TPA: hypothetical protein VH092_16445 [Urbifossiella sp.]|jgi:hypothetical protein|nr:hypothetical protein [Urbifossiella sp.]
MRVYNPSLPSGIPTAVYSVAVQHCQAVFPFRDAVSCTALMLWSVLTWAAARTTSLTHAVARLYPDIPDQTFWNLLRARLSKPAPALEGRLHALLQLPGVQPDLAGRRRTLAIDYHAIPYYGAPKKVAANSAGGNPTGARPRSIPTRPSASSTPAGGTPWR